MTAAWCPALTFAQTSWREDATDGSWANANNWTDGIPSASKPAVFSTSDITTTAINGDKFALGVSFVDEGDGINDFTVNTGSGGVLYLYANGLTVGGGEQTFNCNVRPRNSLTIANDGAGLLNLNGAIRVHLPGAGSATLTFDGDGDIRVARYDRRTSGMNVDLVKQGSGTLTIAGAVTQPAGTGDGAINGSMSILGGTVSINNEANLGADLPVFNPAGLLLNDGALRATASFTIDDANRGITLGAAGGTFEVPNAAHTLTIENPITGGGSLTKIGAGILALSGNNTYAGATTVNQGQLRLLDGGSLSAVHIEGGSMDVAGTLAADTVFVGHNGASGTLTMTGTAAQIGSAANPTDLYVARRTVDTTTNFFGTLDLSGVDTFTAYLNDFFVGTALPVGSGQGRPQGTVTLAPNSTIHAQDIVLGHSPGVGLGGFHFRIVLGTDNTITADTLLIGGDKTTSGSTMEFGMGGGSLTLGTPTERVNVTVGQQLSWTSGGANGHLNMAGGTLDAYVDQLVVGSKSNSGLGTTHGRVTFEAGTLDVNTIILGNRTNAGDEGHVRGTFDFRGGTVLAGSIFKGAGNGEGADDLAAFSFTGGTLHVDTFGSASQPFTLNQDGGTLAPGNSIGTTTIYGNYNQAAAGTLEIEIAGTGVGGMNYDLVDVYGDASLAGWLDVSLLEPFTAELGDYFDVLTTTGSLDVTGLTVTGDAPNPVFGWWDVSVLGGVDGATLRLTAVPEPSTWLMLLAALAGGLLVRRRGPVQVVSPTSVDMLSGTRTQGISRRRQAVVRQILAAPPAPVLSLWICVSALAWLFVATLPAQAQTSWTGASGVDQNWSTAGNWDAGVPGSGDTAQFDDTTGGGAAGVVTNVVNDAFGGEVGTLRYTLRPDNENSFFHTTQIAPGTTLLLTTALEVAPNDFNMPTHRTVDVTITGGAGSGLQVGSSGTRTANIIIANNPDEPSGRTLTGNLNLSALETFVANVDAFRVGDGTRHATGTIRLAQENTIDANSVVLSRASGSNAGTARLLLGQDNTITTDMFIVGGSKSSARVEFANGGSTLDLGTSTARTDLFIGWQANWTSGGATGVMDLSGGTLNAFLNQLVIGSKLGGGQSATGTTSGTLIVDAGTLDVNALRMAEVGSAGTANATLTMRGSTLNVNGAVTHGGGTSTIHLDHGAMDVGGNVSVDHLRVGFVEGNGAPAATFSVGSGSTVRIGDGTGMLTIARQEGGGSDSDVAYGTLDLSLASSTTIDVGEVRMATANARGIQHATLNLGGTTTLTADSLRMADAETGNTPGGRTATLTLGQTNTFNVDTWTIGGRKSEAMVGFDPEVTGGVLNLAGNNNAGADLIIGDNNTGTGVQATSTLDLSGGTFNATLDTLRIARFGSGSGNAKATLNMDAGVVTANEVILAQTGGTNPQNTEGTLTIRGGTLTVNGSVTDGGGTSTVNLGNNAVFNAAGDMVVDTLHVGVDSTVNGSDTALYLTGTTVQIGSTVNQTDLYVGRRTVETTAHYQGTLDATAVTDLTLNLGEFGLGIGPSSASAQGRPGGTVLLGTNNVIEADTITVAHSISVGLGGRTSRLALGSGTNSITADFITIGGSKGAGILDFQASGGTLNLGTDANRVNLTVGNQPVGTSGGSSGSVDFRDGAVIAYLDELILGSKVNAAGGSTIGTLYLRNGLMDVNSIILAQRADAGTAGSVHGIFNFEGGTLQAGSISRSPTNPNTVNDQPQFNFTGGTLHVGTFGSASQPCTLDQDGGTLAPGNSIGTATIYGDYNQAAAGTLEIEIAGTGLAGIDYDLVEVHGDASLAGWLDVVLADPFTAELRDYFDVLTTTGSLDITGLTVTGHPPNPVFGWWDVSVLGGVDGATLRLTAVPEPSGALLLLLALGGGLLVRRRR